MYYIISYIIVYNIICNIIFNITYVHNNIKSLYSHLISKWPQALSFPTLSNTTVKGTTGGLCLLFTFCLVFFTPLPT